MTRKIVTLLFAATLALTASAKRNNNRGWGTPPPPTPIPAATYAPAPAPSLSNSDFKRIVKLTKKESFDEGKLRMVEAISMLGYFTTEQAAELLRTFSFDNSRLDALRFLAPRIVDRGNPMSILKSFTFDSSSKKAAEILFR